MKVTLQLLHETYKTFPNVANNEHQKVNENKNNQGKSLNETIFYCFISLTQQTNADVYKSEVCSIVRVKKETRDTAWSMWSIIGIHPKLHSPADVANLINCQRPNRKCNMVQFTQAWAPRELQLPALITATCSSDRPPKLLLSPTHRPLCHTQSHALPKTLSISSSPSSNLCRFLCTSWCQFWCLCRLFLWDNQAAERFFLFRTYQEEKYG